MSSSCSIPSNPDISGIGVRAAIYAQNLLCFVPALWALWDGKVTVYELESVEAHSVTNLILAFAVLISAIFQAQTLGLSNFHASIILGLSWMNNTNAFMYFLLYVKHKSQTDEPDSVQPNFPSWVTHVKFSVMSAIGSPQSEPLFCPRSVLH